MAIHILEIMKLVLVSLGLSLTFLIIRFGIFLFSKQSSKLLTSLDLREILLEWVFSFILILSFFSITLFFTKLSFIILILLGVTFGSLLISYNFFLYPFIILLRVKKYETSTYYEQWAKLTINKSINIRLINEEMTNAYATGILPISKVILLSKPLVSQMLEEDVKNLIYHEYAHLKYNHLLIMYVSNVVCCTLSIISASHFYPIFESSSYTGLFVGLHGSVFGVFYILIPGIVQRRLEYQADKYAADSVGSASYISTLIKLNTITNGGLDKKVINYPNLQNRITNVSE